MAIRKLQFYPTTKPNLDPTLKIFSPSDARIYNAGQRGVTSTGKQRINDIDGNINKLMTVGSYKKGGKINKTGVANLHKGEVVMPKKVVRKKSYNQVAKSVRRTMGYKG